MPCRSKYAGRNLSPHGGAASVAEDGSHVAMAKNSRTRCRLRATGCDGRPTAGWCDSVWGLPVCLPLQGSCAWSRAGRATRSGSDCPERLANAVLSLLTPSPDLFDAVMFTGASGRHWAVVVVLGPVYRGVARGCCVYDRPDWMW